LQPELFFYSCDVVQRKEPLVIVSKTMKNKVNVREFSKETSVFR
jgi:hypothetical protein